MIDPMSIDLLGMAEKRQKRVIKRAKKKKGFFV